MARPTSCYGKYVKVVDKEVQRKARVVDGLSDGQIRQIMLPAKEHSRRWTLPSSKSTTVGWRPPVPWEGDGE
jgi:hypothetical protein